MTGKCVLLIVFTSTHPPTSASGNHQSFLCYVWTWFHMVWVFCVVLGEAHFLPCHVVSRILVPPPGTESGRSWQWKQSTNHGPPGNSWWTGDFKEYRRGLGEGVPCGRNRAGDPREQRAVQPDLSKGCIQSKWDKAGDGVREEPVDLAIMPTEEFRHVSGGWQRKLWAQRCFRQKRLESHAVRWARLKCWAAFRPEMWGWCAKGAAADGSAGGEAEIPQRQDLTAVECKRQGRVEADLCLIKVPKRRGMRDKWSVIKSNFGNPPSRGHSGEMELVTATISIPGPSKQRRFC